MISDEKIQEIYAKEGLLGIKEFARAIYERGRADQRESDAELCRDAAEKYLERSKNCTTNLGAIAALTSNSAATYLETAIRNTGGVNES